ncbi:hypothetical protein [Brucella suis]|uniref:hypothetical protein n=1 Tax=Brucella suis TaxID=29461 RepID=UPI001CC1A765|nr:hypothetical protein [Brucella suis]
MSGHCVRVGTGRCGFTKIAVESRKAAKTFSVTDDDSTAEIEAARAAAEDAAREAWHAAIALGLWPDTDLDPIEFEWLRGETGKACDPLPPMPLRENRETVYGEWRKVFVGAVGLHFI